jgi:hypothetical protein
MVVSGEKNVVDRHNAWSQSLPIVNSEREYQALLRLSHNGDCCREEKNNELTRLNLRADIVYLIEYKGELRILNMELQTDAEKQMAFRMLVYHLELYDKYQLPHHLGRTLSV